MKFLKNLFKKKEKPQELEIKPFITEFIESEMLNRLKSRKICENAEFILNTLFESNLNPNMGKIEAMGLFFKLRKKIPMNKETLSELPKLFKLFFKFLEKKGLITEEIKKELEKENIRIPQTIKRETPKIGRNAPCSCGSGRKYKLCCGR